MAANTFLGLQPYTEDDAYRFKGRTAESQELFRLIVRNDFTVCYAESGEGKTSLLNAGVFPLLRENMYFPIAITFTSDDYKITPDSFDAIIDRCVKDSITEYNEKNKGVNVDYKLCSYDFQGLDCHAELQRELSKYSWWKLRNYRPQAMGLTFTPVFVFDQFEEVFNLPSSIVWTKKFFDWLEDVSSDSCPDVIVEKIREIIGDKAAFPSIKEEKNFKAIFSLRKEFMGELDYWGMQTHFIPALKDNRYCLKALTYEGAKKVMRQQKLFNEIKVDQVLTYFVKKYSREPERIIEENLPIIPALLLSIVCDSWEKDIDFFVKMDDINIDNSLFLIIEKFYNYTLDKIVQDYLCDLKEKENHFDKSTQRYEIQGIGDNYYRYEIEELLFLLVDRNGKRERTKTTSSRFSQFGFDEKYKKTLCDNHIIKVSKVEGEDYVEIVHDCLCPVINKRKEIRIETEAKALEEQNIRILKQKNRKRTFIIIYSLLATTAFILLAIFMWQKLRIQLVQNNINNAKTKTDSIQRRIKEQIILPNSTFWGLLSSPKDSLLSLVDDVLAIKPFINNYNSMNDEGKIIVNMQLNTQLYALNLKNIYESTIDREYALNRSEEALSIIVADNVIRILNIPNYESSCITEALSVITKLQGSNSSLKDTIPFQHSSLSVLYEVRKEQPFNEETSHLIINYVDEGKYVDATEVINNVLLQDNIIKRYMLFLQLLKDLYNLGNLRLEELMKS